MLFNAGWFNDPLECIYARNLDVYSAKKCYDASFCGIYGCLDGQDERVGDGDSEMMMNASLVLVKYALSWV
jgi:hypothetical protein